MTTVAKDSALNHPNGVAVLPNGTLVVVTFSVPGELYTKGRGSSKYSIVWIDMDKEGLAVKKVQVTIDEETARLLGSLAAPRAGNKSFVVREAVRRMAEQEGFEQYLDWLEQQPRVRGVLERALADERAGRTRTHQQAVRRVRKPGRR